MPEAEPATLRYSQVLSALDEGALVLTASRRLSRELQQSFNEKMKASGRSAWPTPGVFAWQDWLTQLQYEAPAAGASKPLSTAASQLVWERCLRRQVDDSVLGVRGLAREAAAVWRQLGEWKVPAADVRRAARSPDERAFGAASVEYSRTLEDQNWSDPAGFLAECIAILRTSAPDVPPTVVLVGFDRLSPLVRDLIGALEGRGATTKRYAAAFDGAARTLHGYLDEETELRAAGHWARQVAFERPRAQIGIVVGDLEQDATRVLRLVREGFAPGWQVGHAGYEASVEVSYGRRLAEYPAVTVALSCLRWATQGLSSSEVSLLLRTSCLAGGEESARAVFERRLRRVPDRLWSAAALAAALKPRDQEGSGRTFIDNVRHLSRLQLRLSERLPPSSWAEVIDDTLRAIGWPGPASLDSLEFQLINRWRELLNELAGLDDFLGPVTLREATGRLSAMASDVVYQPERSGGIVRVLGPLEAAGMEFDALWVARADADRWPAANHPSSLVSRKLQLDYGLPDSSPADTLRYSRRVLARLAASSPDVHFSWSKTDLDAVRMPSPLLTDLDCNAGVNPADPGWYAARLAGSGDVRLVTRDPVPAVRGEESVGGGAATVQMQRSEPFSAFAAGRLGVRELDPFVPGLNAGMRGSLVHTALEKLFAGRPDQERIKSWSADERERRIHAAVDNSLSAAERQADAVLRRLLALERQRMRTILHAVVEHELTRQPFSIAAVEQRIEFRHAGVKLDLRADRIDRLEDGSVLIIDYKTGRVRPLLDRDGDPADLQVVVYAAAIDEHTGGLSLLHVSRREIVHKAVGSSIDVKPMDAGEWDERLSSWRADVLGLIEAIARGDVRVNLRGDAERRWQFNVLCRAAGEKRAD